MKKKLFILGIPTAGVLVALTFVLVTSAFAAVTFDPTCPYTPSNGTGACGFVGKGDVQTALGWNNAQLQKNAGSLKFTYVQPATQALSQDGTQAGTQDGTQDGTQAGTQAGTQDGTQSMSEVLSCDLSDGHHTFTRDGTRTGTRDGTRDGTRSGSRDGTRTGSRDGTRNGTRAGTLDGNVSYTIDYDARVKNQIDGFFLTKATSTGFVATGTPVWGDWSFGDYTFGDYTFGDYTFGNTTWGDWVAAPGDDPSVCNSGNPGVSNISDVVTPGAITDGAITDGAITPGAPTYGDVTATGLATLYVNGVALP